MNVKRTKAAAKVGMIQLSNGVWALDYSFDLDEGAVKACAWLDEDVDRSVVACSEFQNVALKVFDLANQPDPLLYVSLKKLKVDSGCNFHSSVRGLNEARAQDCAVLVRGFREE